MNEIRPPQPLSQPDIDPLLLEARPVVYVARELRGKRDGVVVRRDDDTDAEYQARSELFNLLLDHAEKG